MKYRVLLLIVLFSAELKAQNLRSVIAGKNGLSNHFTELAPFQQVQFDKQNLNKILGLSTQSDLILIKQFSDAANALYYRYYQTLYNIPVENSMYIIHTKNGLITGMSGEIILDFGKADKLSPLPSLTSNEAVNKALKIVHADVYAWEDKLMAKALQQQQNLTRSYKPNAILVWYNPNHSLNPADLKLAWKINIYAKKPLSYADYFIDAQNGNYLGKKDKIYSSDAVGSANTAYSGSRVIHSDYTGSAYRLRDYTKGDGIITLHGETNKFGNEYYSAAADWNFTNKNKASLDAHYGISKTWLFYKNLFGRNSYDDNNAAVYSYINDPTYLDNAFWDGTAIYINERSNGDIGGTSGIDVCGHEYTHAVTQETSNLVYNKESGGINESLSDIMGKSVQFWSKPNDINWSISNDMNWFIRNMSNPNEFNDPDTYKGNFWNDKGDVHLLSGVGNFMFYLLSSGGSGTNDRGFTYNVRGIGLLKADSIIYLSNLLYLTPLSTYLDWREACLKAARNLFGKNSNEVNQVQNAWNAVGVDSLSSLPCPVPISLIADSLTSTAARMEWKDFAEGAQAYNIQWRRFSVNPPWQSAENISENNYVIENLTPNTVYESHVQSICYENVTSNFTKISTRFSTLAEGNYCSFHGSTAYEFIQSVRYGNKINNSGDNKGYGNYIKVVAPLEKGKTYVLWMKAGNRFGVQQDEYSIYIDYNGDKDFDDAGEKVSSVIATTASEVPLSFKVPLTAKTGKTRIRIMVENNFFKYSKPCTERETTIQGEAEDYTVNLKEASSVIAKNSSAISELSNSSVSSFIVMPNPVNDGEVTMSYFLNKAGQVKLSIVDLSGRKLREYSPGNQQSGIHNYNINALNLPLGNYFFILYQNAQIIGRNKVVVLQH